MNSTKGVIRIIVLANNSNEYDRYYYFTNINVDTDYHIKVNITSNVWDAMKFIYNSPNEDEVKRINSLIEFVKVYFTPKKRYKIEFIPITIEY